MLAALRRRQAPAPYQQNPCGPGNRQYSGGRIERGFLVGVVAGSSFEFRYCQLEAGGVLNGGESKCELRITEDSKVQIVEHFEWASRPGGGRNVIQEVE